MHLRLGERTFATGTRAVDALFRRPLLEQHFYTRIIGDHAIAGRSEDGIGYLMVASWSRSVDLDAVEKALGDLRDTKALVVDARPNAGGDELLARRIAAWFVEGTRTYAKNRYRTGPGKAGFGEVLERQVTGNQDPAKRYDGPIAVLTSPYVMSSNESFVMMLQQAGDCTVVGQKTFGSSGNPRPHQLSNGVTLVLPSWQDLRLDGTCLEGEGLSPDVEVAVDPKELVARDPILERALELLRAKVQSGS
jgi:C-terminal processing protease CtpA/Prc